ncbi:MAG TPA: MBL fold metallo-hydrolase [archaeon]|nr:MBL fold metallo-hydrolase [archaeon]
MTNTNLKIIQLNVGGFDNNFTYIIIGENNAAILIDPTGSKEVIENSIKSNKLNVVAQIVTHSHPDHCELVDYFKEKGIKLVEFDLKKVFEEKEIILAGVKVKAILTPGHLHDSKCFIIGDNIFSGDTLFVKGVGTTHYGGNDLDLEKSLNYLATLDSNLILWPGHNYGGASALLGVALSNSHIKPSKKTHDLIKKKVEDYEKNSARKY